MKTVILKQHHSYLRKAWEVLQENLNPNILNSYNKTQSATVKKTILIIDEAENMRKLLYSVLSGKFNLVVKRSPLDALLWLGKGNIPGMVISEYGLPFFDSATFVQLLRSTGLHGAVPVILLADADSLEQKIEGLPFKVNAIIKKPFNPVSLVSLIQTTLHESNFTIAV